MYLFRVNKLITNDGTEIVPKKINIIVGANNCGKSRFLKDIRNYFGNSNYNSENMVVLKDIYYNLPTSTDEFIEKYNLDKRVIFNPNGSSYIRNYYGANLENLVHNNSIENYIDNNHIGISSDWKKDIDSFIISLNRSIPPDIDIPSQAYNIRRVSKDFMSYEIDGVTHEKEIGGSSGPYDIEQNIKSFNSRFGTLFYHYLGTEEKLFLCKKQKRYGVDALNINLLSEAQFHLDDFKKLSNLTHELFGKYLYLDRISYTDSIVIRVSDDFDFYNNIILDDERSEAKLRSYSLLDEEGDGIKNFVTSFLSIKTMNKDIILMDEPESFLHPPLAKRFGEIIAKEIEDNQQLFIATHSEDLINGILLSTPYTKINIIHIQRERNQNIFRVFCDKQVYSLKRKPVILMSNILKGLFSDKVYITESFADSALYSIIMSKYNAYSYFFFVNTESKSKAKDVMKIYDQLGIDNVAIFDFDYFRDIGTVTDTLGLRMDASSSDYCEIVRVFAKVNQYLNDRAVDRAKNAYPDYDSFSAKEKKEKARTCRDYFYHRLGLRSILDKELKSELKCVLRKLKKYGIYVLESGCLESLLEGYGLGFSDNKPVWIDNAIDLVDHMGIEEIKKMNIHDLIENKISNRM